MNVADISAPSDANAAVRKLLGAGHVSPMQRKRAADGSPTCATLPGRLQELRLGNTQAAAGAHLGGAGAA